MSLIICPDCGTEVSTAAPACPTCGRPISPAVLPAVSPDVIVREVVPPDREFPKWVFIPIAVLGVVIVFLVIAMMRKGDESANERNINIKLPADQRNERVAEPTSRSAGQPNEIVVPGSSTTTTSVPQSTPQIVQQIVPGNSTTTATSVTSDKGTLALEAKTASRGGGTSPVKAEKFYLLDKDLDSILAGANIDDESGQGPVTAFALSVVYPDRYRETNQKGLAAIKKHIVYSTITDSQGKAQIKDIKPNNYYLFGITATKGGYSLWNSSVSVNAGANSLVLPAQSPTEIQEQ
jgi:hypothetical protein